jgi:hypothetical protein
MCSVELVNSQELTSRGVPEEAADSPRASDDIVEVTDDYGQQIRWSHRKDAQSVSGRAVEVEIEAHESNHMIPERPDEGRHCLGNRANDELGTLRERSTDLRDIPGKVALGPDFRMVSVVNRRREASSGIESDDSYLYTSLVGNRSRHAAHIEQAGTLRHSEFDRHKSLHAGEAGHVSCCEQSKGVMRPVDKVKPYPVAERTFARCSLSGCQGVGGVSQRQLSDVRHCARACRTEEVSLPDRVWNSVLCASDCSEAGRPFE